MAPRKKQAPSQAAVQNAEATATDAATPNQTNEKKWAEPYRPLVTNPDAGFEMGENKHTRQMVFYFGQDPGAEVKKRLKHFGYFYHADQKAWTVNATAETREIGQTRYRVRRRNEQKSVMHTKVHLRA